MIERPPVEEDRPQHLCADAGYAGEPARQSMEARHYTPHVRSRGEEKSARQKGKQPRRWVVEVTFSWLNRFRKLLVQFEKKAGKLGVGSLRLCAHRMAERVRLFLFMHKYLFADKLLLPYVQIAAYILRVREIDLSGSPVHGRPNLRCGH